MKTLRDKENIKLIIFKNHYYLIIPITACELALYMLNQRKNACKHLFLTDENRQDWIGYNCEADYRIHSFISTCVPIRGRRVQHFWTRRALMIVTDCLMTDKP